MRNVLIIFSARTHPMRASQRDHLWSFRSYAEGCRCFYLNVAFGGVPSYLARIRFDLIVFHWSFVGTRVSREWFTEAMKRIDGVRAFSGVKVAMPQDEFVSMDLMCEFINRFGVEVVFSVAPGSEWPKLYRTVDFGKVRFVRLLTGYLDDETIRKWNRPEGPSSGRTKDIGYRTVSRAIWGRFNLVKGRIAEIFAAAAPGQGLKADIAVGEEHFKMGDEWLEFLSECRYTLGVEGGSSLLDWDGKLSEAIYAYLRRNPGADFDELERECIPVGRDGEISVVAISPRHLEACLTRTGQILVEGEYNGVLRPHEHYIPLKKDYSNLQEVITLIKDEPRRREMVETAYRDIVDSGRYSYRHMVRTVLEVLPGGPVGGDSPAATAWYWVNRALGACNAACIYLYSRLRDARNAFVRGSR